MDPNVFETANAGFAQALYEEFLRDPNAVAPEWRSMFESGRVGEKPAAGASAPAGGNGAGATTAKSPTPPNSVPIKGPAARLVHNMNESRSVPTATTFREIAVRALEAARTGFNSALKNAGRPEKASFTHFIAWALVQAVKRHPVMVQSFAEIDGQPHRVTPDGIHLGLAVDVERKDGSRGLVVPVLKHAEQLTYAEFQAAYDTVVEKARSNRLMPDDFAGGSMTLTNPGGLGTVASVPRLMAGQGSIIAVGAIGFPPEFTTSSAERIAELGISKVMTITSTYDHRLIQGAESGEFLRTVEKLLAGDEGFYQEIFAAFGLSWADGRTGGQAGNPGPSVSPTVRLSVLQPPSVGPSLNASDLEHVAAAMALVKAHRTHGHLAARLDPLGTEPGGDPSLDPAPLGLTPEVMAQIPASVLRIAVPGATLAEAFPNLQATYCGTIAYEVEHVGDHRQRVWLRQMIESGAHRRPLPRDEKLALLDRLIAVEALERFLHKAYLGQKRFSIEGVDLLVPMLDLTFELSSHQGAREVVVGMAHRGRLNVLAHNVGRPYVTIFAEFEGGKKIEGEQGEPEDGTGDVKYHHGAEGAYLTRSGKAITVALAHNPSHLEFVGPVVDGNTRARQTQRRGQEAHHDPSCAVPVVIHGDAAFAGQGVVAESLNLSALRGYRVGGTIHLITNNQVGFTTDMADARSTRHASDLAKGFDIPIIHVNADDAEACLAAVRLAMFYRQEFRRDALIDLVGYRRWGHNEGDEPAYTQPLMYERIKTHPSARELYASALVGEGVSSAEEVQARYDAAYQKLIDIQQGFRASAAKAATVQPAPAKLVPGEVVNTAVPEQQLSALNEQLLQVPDGFTVNPKLKRQLERRRAALTEGGIDWGHAEVLALASLLTEGVPIRLTGQDSERGTFSHRHLVLHDAENGVTYAPIQHLAGALAACEVYNSPLSELATLGFEYGYATAASDSLVLWEAQYGDFINGAQVIVDQFMAAGLAKWGVTNRLTLLLPHGYEGGGPEHSSARVERFLQLAAEGNFRVANCTTPAQYFHLLRRQARRNRVRPLVIFTPKSLLRLPQASSRLEELSAGVFQPVLDDPSPQIQGSPEAVTRMVLCTGKLYYDLLPEADKLGKGRPALVRVEGLYTFPEDKLRGLLTRYGAAKRIVWAQEEPRNMGAWSFVAPRLAELLPAGAELEYVGRPDRASPAEGYGNAHAVEQSRIVAEALAG